MKGPELNFNNFRRETEVLELEKSPELLKLEEKLKDLKDLKESIIEANKDVEDLPIEVSNFLEKLDSMIKYHDIKIEELSK